MKAWMNTKGCYKHERFVKNYSITKWIVDNSLLKKIIMMILNQVTVLCLLLMGLMSATATSITTKSKNPDETKTKVPPRRLVLVPKTVYVPHYTSGDPNDGPYEAYLAPKVEDPTTTLFLAPQVATAPSVTPAPPAQPVVPAVPAVPVPPKVSTMQYSYPTGYHYPPPTSYFVYPSYPGYPMTYQPAAYQPQMPIMNQYSSYSYIGVSPQYPAVPLDFQNLMSGYFGTTSSVTGVYSSAPVPVENAHTENPTTEWKTTFVLIMFKTLKFLTTPWILPKKMWQYKYKYDFTIFSNSLIFCVMLTGTLRHHIFWHDDYSAGV